MAVYGWPMYVWTATGCCKLCPYLKCPCAGNCCLNKKMFNCCFKNNDNPTSIEKKNSITSEASGKMFVDQVSGDNCCACNYAGNYLFFIILLFISN